MSLSDDGIADSEEMRQPRGAVPRVMASLIVAFFAYLGLALGGGFGTFASTETNNFSAAKGNQQPHYLSLRDNARGIVAAERDATPKAGWLDGNAAVLAFGAPIHLVRTASACLLLLSALPAATGNCGAYLARGPPGAAA